MTDQSNKPFSFSHDRVLFLLNRSDMGGLNYIVCRPDISDGDFAKAVMMFTDYWYEFVYHQISDFAGLDVSFWAVFRGEYDQDAMNDDHMSGDTTYNLDFSDGHTDGVSGFENVNLVDRHRIEISDSRHPGYAVARAIYDEICVTSGPDDREYGIHFVESVVPVGNAEFIGTSKEGRCYEAVVQYNNGDRSKLLVTMNSDGTCLEDFETI